MNVHGHVQRHVCKPNGEDVAMAARPRRLRAGILSLDLMPRHLAPLPSDRRAALPWLVVGPVLVTPFEARPGGGGLSDVEAQAIDEMRQLMVSCPLSAD